MKKFILFPLILFVQMVHGQSQGQPSDSVLTKAISSATLENDGDIASTRRGFLRARNVKGIKRLNPLLYISSGLIYTYQNLFSEQIQANCTYEVSCSSYTKRCIERHGFIVGLLMGLDQMSACFMDVKKQYPEYKISDEDLIDNRFED